jgi:hypothetical protein
VTGVQSCALPICVPKGRSTGRVPAARSSTARLARTATASQRVPIASDADARKKSLMIGLGAGGGVVLLLLVLVAGRGGGHRRPVSDDARKQVEAVADLVAQKQFPEADDLLHGLLSRKDFTASEHFRRAEAMHGVIHPVAELERAARREVPAWLDRAGKLLSSNAASVEDGAALYDEGKRVLERFGASTYGESIGSKVKDLKRFKGQLQSDAAFAHYQEVAETSNQLRKDKAFGEAIKRWEGLKGESLDAIAASKIGFRIQEIQTEAAAWVQEVAREAEGMRKEGQAAEGLKRLEAARAGLAGTAAAAALEEQIRLYQKK